MLDEFRSVARKVSVAHHLRGLLIDCKRLLSERGEANSVVIARNLVSRFAALPDEQQQVFFERPGARLQPRPAGRAGRPHKPTPSQPDADNLLQLTRPPSRRARSCCVASTARPAAPRASCAMRRALLARLPKQPELQAVEADFLHLLSSWFNPGFLQLRARRLELAGAAAREDHPPRGSARDRRLGRPAATPAARSALLRVLPPAAAAGAADLRGGGAAAADARRDRAVDRQGRQAPAARASSRWPRSIRSATASPGCAACRWATS